MSAKEKAKAKAEQVVGKAMRKTGRVTGKRTTEVKGAALGLRGEARERKEKTKDFFKR
ncbi:hypothetical protein MIU24_19790 [Streptomyces venezuelae]|uniref:hypothetical protein n=1 Tax=Streptomyces sp. B6(2022) TaxID=3404749 RepID=UPI00311DDB38